MSRFTKYDVLDATDKAVKIKVSDTESAWIPKMATDYYTGNFHTKYIVTKAVAKNVCVSEWFKIEPKRDQDLVNALKIKQNRTPKDPEPPTERANRMLGIAVDQDPGTAPCCTFNEEGLLIRGLGSLLPTELAREYLRRIKKHNANKELV
jgi:hypothetical protein